MSGEVNSSEMLLWKGLVAKVNKPRLSIEWRKPKICPAPKLRGITAPGEEESLW